MFEQALFKYRCIIQGLIETNCPTLDRYFVLYANDTKFASKDIMRDKYQLQTATNNLSRFSKILMKLIQQESQAMINRLRSLPDTVQTNERNRVKKQNKIPLCDDEQKPQLY